MNVGDVEPLDEHMRICCNRCNAAAGFKFKCPVCNHDNNVPNIGLEVFRVKCDNCNARYKAVYLLNDQMLWERIK